MEASTFFRLVKDNLQYLIEEYGFIVLKEEIYPRFDNVEIVFQSPDFRVRVARDKGDVLLHISSLVSPEYWYDLRTIVAYLTKGAVRGWDYDFSPDDDYDLKLEGEVKQDTGVLRLYCAQIRDLARQGILEQKRAEMHEIMTQLIREWFEKHNM